MKTAVSPDVLREEAAARFEHLGWPTPRLEEWRATSLAPISRIQWSAPSLALGAGSVPTGAVDTKASLAGRAAAELIFVNGMFVSESGGQAILPARTGTIACPPPSIEEHLGRYADFEQHAMVALNMANFRDGAFIEVPANTVVAGFIHLLFIGNGDGVWSHPRNLIVVGRNSQVTIVETYVGTGQYFTNAVTEVVAEDGAVIDHYKIECESRDAFHVATLQFHQQRASSVRSHNISVGGALVRNDVNSVLAGEGANLVLDGLFVLTGNQHVDNHTLIDHVSPHCESHELYKGILDQNARGIFDGRIIVRPHAQKTISRQENRNLLLSESAIADSKPTLEILNDDVKCNHGSTIGQLEDEPMFYLRSRGLGEEEARALLIYAFAAEIVDRMKVEPAREQIRRALFQVLPDRREGMR